MKYWNKTYKGEISAFLSLTLVLILALVGTTIESAWVYGEKRNTERFMVSAMESALSEYYYPLYQDYHLFLLDGGYGEVQRQDDLLEDILMEYMDDPPLNLKVEEIVGFMDYEYQPFIHEAVSYMKYKMPARMIESVGEKNSYAKDSAQYAEVIEKKIEVEETTSQLSESMLALIRNIEGIKVDKKGVHFTKKNLIKTEDNFVKKFLVVEKNSTNVGVAHGVVYQSLEGEYKQPMNWLDEIIRAEKVIIDSIDQIEILTEELEKLNNPFPFDNIENKGKRGKEQEEEEKEAKDKKKRNTILNQIEELEKEITDSLKMVKDRASQLVKLTRGTEERIEKVLEIIPQVVKYQQESETECRSYGEYLEKAKATMNSELYMNLQEDKTKIQNYIQNLGSDEQHNLSGNRLTSMKKILLDNKQILSAVYPIEQMGMSASKEDAQTMISFLIDLKKIISGYKIKELWFDYSSLEIKSKVKNPISSFNKFIGEGILNLVVDDVEKISKKEIKEKDLPSTTRIKRNEIKESSTLLEGMEEYEQEGSQSKVRESMGEYGTLGRENTINEANQLLETILLQEYFLTHFKSQNEVEDNLIKETCLEYEQEYLVCGNLTDYDNYKEIVEKLLFTRAIMNFLYLFTDKEKVTLAYATAAALVGFTCLEPLISLTKTMILLVWAYQEALVDVKGLLAHKAVPFLKSKKSFQVNYEELLIMNKELIQKKQESFPKQKISANDLNYDDYLRIYLFLINREKKCLRTFDLIQKNMNLRYQDKFRIKNGIFGYRLIGKYNINAKFIRFPFVQQILENDITGYEYTMRKEKSY